MPPELRQEKVLLQRRSLVRWLSIVGAAVLFVVRAASAADVQVMISSGFHGVYSELAPAFERASGHHLVTIRGPSMGDSPEAIPARLARGEAADVVILDGGRPTSWASKDWCAAAASRPRPLADRHGGAQRRRKAGHRQRRGIPEHATYWRQSRSRIRTAAAVPICRLRFSPSSASQSRSRGRAGKCADPPSGEPGAAVVARGEAEIGFQQVSELMHVPGIAFVGTIPAEVQPAIFLRRRSEPGRSGSPRRRSALIRFLASARAAASDLKAGLLPLSGR